MHHVTIARQLAQQTQTIRSLAAGITVEQARWKPSLVDWSILEVINHLYDEEREDFRPRVAYILHGTGEAPAAIDPVAWVTERGYNERTLAQSLQNFLEERERSVAWLHELPQSGWDNSYAHPSGFTISARQMLACWAAHDLLHARQLVELHYAWHQTQVAPLSLVYAGDW